MHWQDENDEAYCLQKAFAPISATLKARLPSKRIGVESDAFRGHVPEYVLRMATVVTQDIGATVTGKGYALLRILQDTTLERAFSIIII